MRLEKWKKIKSFFLSDNRKTRQKEHQESIVLDPLSSSPNVRSDSYFSDQNPSIDEMFDEICDRKFSEWVYVSRYAVMLVLVNENPVLTH